MGSWKQGSGGATEKMTTNTHVLSIAATRAWDVWRGQIGDWLITRGLRIGMLLIAAVLAVRFVTWVAEQVARQIDERFVESDALVRSEASKHRQAVASVISVGVHRAHRHLGRSCRSPTLCSSRCAGWSRPRP